MKARELAVPGAWEITPQVHTDPRGAFFEWFTDSAFTEFAGHRLDLRQANCSVSSAGVLRGVHFAQLPPSQAKYVTCLRGVGVRRGRRHSSRLADIREVGCGACSTTATSVGLPLRGTRPRFPCAGRRFDGDVPVLGGLRPPTANTPSTRSTRRSTSPGPPWTASRSCRTATARRRPWRRCRRRVCCRHGTTPGRSSTSCAVGTHSKLR